MTLSDPEHRPEAMTLERAVQVVGCPRCHAPIGQPCKTPGGRLAPCHGPRYAAAKLHVGELAKLARWNWACGEGGQ